MKVVGCKWDLKMKHRAAAEVEHYKAKLVAKSLLWKYGKDLDQTFVPIVKHSSKRRLLNVVVSKQMQTKHLAVCIPTWGDCRLTIWSTYQTSLTRS